MWPQGVTPSQAGPRSSSDSSVVIVDAEPRDVIELPPEACQVPPVGSINNSSKIHIGNKFVSVTNNVHSNEVVKGRWFCVELVSPTNGKRLRCSVAVFVCWTLIVVCGLAIYLFDSVLAVTPTILDLDVSFLRYMLDLAKNTTRAERVSCSVAVLLLILCTILIVYFTVFAQKPNDKSDDKETHWYITRTKWLARLYNTTDTTTAFEPLRLVIIAHTASTPCYYFQQCCIEIRSLQNYYLDDKGYDLPYNFIVGNDGRVYEGLGWNKEGAHTYTYNKCSLGIGFVGDYREEEPIHNLVTDQQLNRTLMILDEGVRLGYIHPNYKVLGAKDLRPTESPGSNLHNAIKKWDHYDHKSLYRNKTCRQIYDLPIEEIERTQVLLKDTDTL